MRALNPYFWCIPLAIVSFLASRGKDGQLMLFFVGFGVIGCGYLVTILWDRQSSEGDFAGYFVAMLGAGVLPLCIDNQLDGMAGMLNLFIPFGTMGIIVTGVVARGFRRRR